MPLGIPARPGSMGIPLPGVRLDVDDGELVADPSSVPTFFLGYLGEEPPPAGPSAVWRTGDRVERDEQGFLHFVGRTDDLIVSAGYRIGPFEVESALGSHAAVAEAAVVGRARRRARHASCAPSSSCGTATRPPDELARELQDHVKDPHGALQVPADRRLRARAPANRQRQARPRRAALAGERRRARRGAGPSSGGGGWRWVRPRPPRPGSRGV